ncbi:MAG: 50S ribosomal protein L29 [bacterium]
MSKKNSLTNHSAEDLHRLVADKRDELRDLRFAAGGSKNRNVKLISTLRKTVARALTEQRAQELARLNLEGAGAKV